MYILIFINSNFNFNRITRNLIQIPMLLIIHFLNRLQVHPWILPQTLITLDRLHRTLKIIRGHFHQIRLLQISKWVTKWFGSYVSKYNQIKMYLNSEMKNGIESEMCEDRIVNTKLNAKQYWYYCCLTMICPHSIQSLSV